MNPRMLSSLFLVSLLSFAMALGSSRYGVLFFALGILAILAGRREIAFVSCVGWGVFSLSLLVTREANVVFSMLAPLLVVSFWEALAMQRTVAAMPEAVQAIRKKSKRLLVYMGFLFCLTLIFHGFLATFSLSSPLFFVVILSFLILLSLYFFASKDF